MSNVNIIFEGYNNVLQGYNEGGYNQDVAFTGLTSGLGSVTTVQGVAVTVSVSGNAGTSAVGSVTATGGIGVAVTGVSGSATVGNTTETAGGGISLGVTGVEGISAVSSVSIWSEVDPSQTPNYQAISTTQTPNWTDIAA